MKEPILSREEIDAIAKAVVPSFAEWTASCEAYARAIEATILERLCGEPVAWQWRRGNAPWSLDRTFNTEVFATTNDSEVRALYAINRSKA
ncbi:hypothetical protein [Burkholderia cepacia]|uniref:hypothetical protein n=1 Tax=Burkholderia cepacia TaxID=292 RepID=UPI003D67FEA2